MSVMLQVREHFNSKSQRRSANTPRRAKPETPVKADDEIKPGAAVFAIRHDGQLGIDNSGMAVSLPKLEVQRLQEFLKTVSSLWN